MLQVELATARRHSSVVGRISGKQLLDTVGVTKVNQVQKKQKVMGVCVCVWGGGGGGQKFGVKKPRAL